MPADQDETSVHPLTGSAGRSAFLAFRFAVELATIAVLAWAGASAGRAGLAVRIILAIGGPVLLIVIWGLFMAPTARRRLREPARLVAEMVIFAASAGALAAAGHVLGAIIYGVIAVGAAAVGRVVAPGA